MNVFAAKNAWWSIELATLKKLASAWGVEVGRDKLFETCVRMTMRVLMCDEGAAVDITAKRIPKMLGDDLFTDELLQVEESHTVLDQSDARKVTEEKKRSLLVRETYGDFLSDFK